jgi:hypothetical protein
MAVTAARITASTAPVALNSAAGGGERLYVVNTGANPADLGPSNVAAGAGYLLGPNASASFELDANDVLYAIRSGGTDAILAVLRL